MGSLLITGGSGSIGKAIAEVFYENGYSIVFLGRNIERLEKIRDGLLKGDKGWIDIVRYDAKEKREKEIVDEVFRRHKDINILVNGAGIGYYESLSDLDDEITEYIFQVNFFAPIRLTKAFLSQGGSHLNIINILSISARLPVPFSGIYAASKAALYMEMESARGELPPSVKILNVLPGRIESEFSKNAPGTKYFSHGGKRASAEDLAHVIYKAFLRGKREVIWPVKYRYILYFQRMFPKIYEEKMKKLKKEYEEKR